jgi:hypothetical protein
MDRTLARASWRLPAQVSSAVGDPRKMRKTRQIVGGSVFGLASFLALTLWAGLRFPSDFSPLELIPLTGVLIASAIITAVCPQYWPVGTWSSVLVMCLICSVLALDCLFVGQPLFWTYLVLAPVLSLPLLGGSAIGAVWRRNGRKSQ